MTISSLNALSDDNDIMISVKVNEKIITNHDILREIEYLKILNPQLKQLDLKRNYKIAKNSLINEIIKKNELTKYFKFNVKLSIIDKIYEDFHKNLGFTP